MRTVIWVSMPFALVSLLMIAPWNSAPARGVVLLEDLAGEWDGGKNDWGMVTIEKDGTGTYSGTYNGKLGVIKDISSVPGEDRKFMAEWHESSATKGHPLRKGEFTLAVSGDKKTIMVEWKSTDNDETRGKNGKSTWTKK